MIVPSARLLLLSVLLVIPLTTLAVFSPGAMAGVVAVLLVLALIAFMDSLRARRQLDGVTVELPDVMRVTRGNEVILPVKIRNEGMRCRRLAVGLAFEEALGADRPIVDLTLPLDSEFAEHEWKIQTLKRGRARFDRRLP